MVNVGIGMVISELNKQNKKLKAMQKDVIENHRIFKERFENASLVPGSEKAGSYLLVVREKKKKANQELCMQKGVCWLVMQQV